LLWGQNILRQISCHVLAYLRLICRIRGLRIVLRFLIYKLLIFDDINSFLLNFLRLTFLGKLLKGLEYSIACSLLLKAQHILFVFVHDSKTEPSFVLKVLFGHFEQSELKLIVIGLFSGLFLYIKIRRITTDITLVPYWKSLLFFNVGLGICKVYNDFLTTEAFDDTDEEEGLALLVALLEWL
jgi:hypothetical protein